MGILLFLLISLSIFRTLYSTFFLMSQYSITMHGKTSLLEKTHQHTGNLRTEEEGHASSSVATLNVVIK